MDQNLLQDWAQRTLLGALGIEMLLMTEDRVEAKMPIDHRTHQPYGILHGGASAALAETVASVGSYLIAKRENSIAVGVDLNITHLKSKRHGWVKGIATPIKLGRNLHVWNVDIVDEEGTLIAKAKLTTMVKPAK
jgi:uncharacterized protein (TIGR00369 family)